MSAKREKTSTGLRDELAALKRERVLAAATRLFSQHGYHGCSMDMIAADLGVTKPFVYYQFQDKADILVAICRLGAELSMRAAAEAEQATGEPAARLHGFCRALCEIVIDHGAAISVYSREISNLPPEQKIALERVRAEIDRTIARLIQAGINAGSLRDEHPLIQARAITGMITYMHFWYRGASILPREALAELIAEMAMRMVRIAP